MKHSTSASNMEAAAALERLQAGNDRFVAGAVDLSDRTGPEARSGLVEAQSPFAIVLGCSDSRVPAEIVFDAGLGDLFVIRVAGNIVAPSLVGSVEFAAAAFGTRLVVVLGHTGCGAVKAAVEERLDPGTEKSPNLRSIVDRILPTVDTVLEAAADAERDAVERRTVRANVRNSADQLRHGSAILERLIASEGLRIVGAEYSLETGEVEFFAD